MTGSLRDFGLYGSVAREARERLTAGAALDDVVTAAYTKPNGAVDGLGLALLHRCDPRAHAAALADALGVPADDAAAAAAGLRARTAAGEFPLTGAEATALLLADAGCEVVFGYPGTSELALCDAVARTPGVRMVNARGDKEAAFMAAGASAAVPGKGAAVLHGARGLTNAAGGIADARRNECGSVAVVGLPSTASARFLPPHGEHGLLDGIGRFAKSWYELPAVAPSAVDAFVDRFTAALGDAAARPHGPVLVGLPQDVAQAAWLPYAAVDAASRAAAPVRAAAELDAAVDLLGAARRVVVLVDDYLLRYPDAAPALAAFCARTGAVVLQVHYRRGPMLFGRLDPREVPGYLGWLDPGDPGRQKLLHEADLLVTLEDRNMYQRVVGDLPPCRKLALTSDPVKARKNEYLGAGDLLVEGEVPDLLRRLAARLPEPRPAWVEAGELPEPVDVVEVTPLARASRDAIGAAFAQALGEVERPVLVDDGQMFGGLLAESHDRFPPGLRIHGDHGGFVGGGLAFATGLALGEPDAHVVVTLGDQGFGNGFQGLVAAVEQRAPVTYVVCNNGGSVSLLTQARAARERLFDDGDEPFLANSPVEPTTLAEAFGIPVERIDFTAVTERSLPAAAAALTAALRGGLASRGPFLVELRLPADESTWSGIWLTGGFDEAARHRAERAS